MKTISLGKTDIKISAIGLGCWQFSDAVGFAKYFWPALPTGTVAEIIDTALKGGINWFDTAEVYGWGASERALASALKALGVKPKSVVIATKWFPFFRTARSIQRTIGARIEALGDYPIDLYQIHMPYSLSSIPKQMEAMADILAENKIRAVGVSNFSRKQMEQAHEALRKRGLVLASNQVRYHLLDRTIEKNGVLDAAKDLGVTIIAYSPLAQGLLSGKYHGNPELMKKLSVMRRRMNRINPNHLEKTKPLIDELVRVAEKNSAAPAEVALAWLIRQHGDLVAAIPGASKPEHAAANVRALSLVLTDEDLARIDEISTKVSNG